MWNSGRIDKGARNFIRECGRKDQVESVRFMIPHCGLQDREVALCSAVCQFLGNGVAGIVEIEAVFKILLADSRREVCRRRADRMLVEFLHQVDDFFGGRLPADENVGEEAHIKESL